MNRNEIESDPHALIEGMAIGAYITGATDGSHLHPRRISVWRCNQLNLAIAQAREYGLLGKDILGRGFNFDIDVVEGAGAFVCGEETALIASLEGAPGVPARGRPSRRKRASGAIPPTSTTSRPGSTSPRSSPAGRHGSPRPGAAAAPAPRSSLWSARSRTPAWWRCRSGVPLGDIVHAIGGGSLQRPSGQGGADRRAVGRLHPARPVRHPGRLRIAGQARRHHGFGRHGRDGRRQLHGRRRPLLHPVHPLRILRQMHALPGGTGQGAAHSHPHHQGRGARGGSGRPRRTGADDPRNLALRAGADGAELAAHHAAPFPRRVRGPHPRPALPSRRLPGPGPVAVREQLPAAHEHPALPPALQGGAAGGRVPVRDHGQSPAGLDRPGLPASVRQPVPAPDRGRGGQHARGASPDRRQRAADRRLRRNGGPDCRHAACRPAAARRRWWGRARPG